MRFTDEKDATEKMKECCPGQPHIIFSTKPGVKIEFVNPIPHSGFFNQFITVTDGESYEKIVGKLAKNYKAIKSTD